MASVNKTAPRKRDFPVGQVRRYLEPGPVVLVTSRHAGRTDVMTMGWHTVLEFTPSLVGCLISSANHSFDLIRFSGECVINVPSADMIDAVVGIGATSGAKTDKFAQFGLTAEEADHVGAPLIRECPASFECRLYDSSLVDRLNFFVFEVVKAHAVASPRLPRMLHYTGDGIFLLSGDPVDKSRLFRPDML